MSRGLERSMELASMILATNDAEPELAGPEFQFENKHPFGDWRVTGPSFIKAVREGSGRIIRHPTTPVKCTCRLQLEREVRTRSLIQKKSLSCGHNKLQSLESWKVSQARLK